MGQTTLLTANLGHQCLRFTPPFRPFQLQRSLKLFHDTARGLLLDTKNLDAYSRPRTIPIDLEDEEVSPLTVQQPNFTFDALPKEEPPSLLPPPQHQQEQVQQEQQQVQHGEDGSQKERTELLQLPTDILYLISDHLDAPSSYSLALTCRGMWQASLPQTRQKLEGQDKASLLLTLENDRLADGFFFCHRCNRLHSFEKTWGPRSPDERAAKGEVFHCSLRDRFSPTGNAYEMAHHHLRLAMNAHLHGTDQGIPLRNLCVEHEQKRQATTINCRTSAAVHEGELLLNRVYAFEVANDQAAAFRASTGFRDFRLCEHVPFFRQSSIYHQNVPELLRRARGGPDEFVACAGAPGSCGICLMDYDVTIRRLDGGARWAVSISAYHLLGDGRDPDDWKWARFTEKSRPHLFLPNRPNRRGSGYAAGVVKRTWSQAARRNEVVTASTGLPLKRHSI
ncbi:hypothetical protein N3K66_008044 [Trichothecium roseum]|uniref:Uncharacterized protein n=1 Tax=Trichothecium roseum TaxID=47278 RepID=A0ACC0USV2_9HYPO|nr:hypothetical protein N3K66_008044 [Trichothecium roseum]